MPKKRAIHDPHLDQFLFDLMYSSTREQRSRFPAKMQHIFNSSKAAQNFCVRASLEEKEYVMSLLGVRWFKVYALDQFTVKDVRDLLTTYKESGQSKLLQNGVENNVYVYSDKQIISLLSILADTEQHPSYIFNIDVKKCGYHLKKWSRKIVHSQHDQTNEAVSDFNFITKNVLNTQRAFWANETLFELKQSDMMVLFDLYQSRFTYTKAVEVQRHFDGLLSKSQVTSALRRLLYLQYVQSNFIARKTEFSITALGIDKINSFVKYVLKANNFQ